MIIEQKDSMLDTFDEFEYFEFPVHIHEWDDI
jgi:hypothetical protein